MRSGRRRRGIFRYIAGFFAIMLILGISASGKGSGFRKLLFSAALLFGGEDETAAESAMILLPKAEYETAVESAYQFHIVSSGEKEETEASAAENADRVQVAADYAPEIVNHTDYKIDSAELCGSDGIRLAMDGNPEILIVHTHSSESYTSDSEYPYLPDDVMRTLDTKYNVVRIGDEITAQLEAAGIGVLHDREINDYPSYNGSYSQMLKRIKRHIEENPSIKMVLDIHRDAILDEDGNNIPMRAQVDGEDCARLMFVVGTDAGGLSHPAWRKNLAFAASVQGYGDTRYPGLMRPIDLRKERFNQHMTAASVILEVGSAGNTLGEALKSAEYFTRILLDALGL